MAPCALICTIHSAMVQNILFEDGDGANICPVFNQIQVEETYSKYK